MLSGTCTQEVTQGLSLTWQMMSTCCSPKGAQSSNVVHARVHDEPSGAAFCIPATAAGHHHQQAPLQPLCSGVIAAITCSIASLLVHKLWVVPDRCQVCLTLHLNVIQREVFASASLWECVSWLMISQAVIDAPAHKHVTYALLRLLLYQAYKADFGSEQLQAIHGVRVVLKVQAGTQCWSKCKATKALL